MHKVIIVAASVFFLIGISTASAHETRSYLIDGVVHSFTVGSIGEPIVVDDKTGLDLTVNQNGKPLAGVEAELKVEVQSGDAKKTFDLETVYNAPGKYKTIFFITSPEPLRYRIFGTINESQIDVLFECAAAGHQMHAVEDKTRVTISDTIVQTSKRGAFGCPAPKSEYEFPVSTGDQSAIVGSIDSNKKLGLAALGVSLLALVFSIVPAARARSGSVGIIDCMNTKLMYRLAALVAIIVVGYGLYAYVPWTKQDAVAAPDKHANHTMEEVAEGKPVPTVSIEAIKDSKDGYNLRIQTTNFTFTPEEVGGENRANTGHAHLYVNGVKVARLYGEWFNLGNAQLKGGENVIEVTLNANDHSEWTVSGEHIAAKITITK